MDSTKYALITGASGGIGYELARLIAAGGHNLVLAARSVSTLEERAAELRDAYGVQVIVIPADLSVEAEVTKLTSTIRQRNLSIDILVNNAGFGDFGDFADTSSTKALDMLKLNISALTALTHACLQEMKREGSGKIMNVASTAAFMPGPGMAVYYASKAYVLSFSEALAQELKGSGITVTALCPGPTDTGFAEAAGLGKSLLHRMLPAATARQVARSGYKAMMRGRTIVIPGLMNYLSAVTPRFLPRPMVRRLIHSIHRNH